MINKLIKLRNNNLRPKWFLRQAGRHIPEYFTIRNKHSDFIDFCLDERSIINATILPLKYYNIDAAILFSDILTVPDAMGLGLYFIPGEGPKFKNRIRSAYDINNLNIPNINKDLGYVFEAVRVIGRELNGSVPLIGFAGSPFTVGTYMVEGGSSREFFNIKALAKEEPNTLDLLMNVIAETTIEYLNGQIDAGVQAIQIFDTWGAILDNDDFRRFSMQSMQKIIEGLIREKNGQRIPIIVFTKGAGSLLSELADIGCDALGVDWSIDLETARKYVKDKVALQGNLNPKTLLDSPENIRQGVLDTLTSYGQGPGHVFNLGHGITPDVNPEHLAVLVNAVHEFSPSFHD